LKQNTPTLEELGWTAELAESFKTFSGGNMLPARVIAEHRSAYDVICANGAYLAEVSGAFRGAAASKSDFPAVGDWTAISFSPSALRQTIHAILPRRTKLSRRNPGMEEEQVIAANIDTVFIVQGLDDDYNLKRLGRYLAAARNSGADMIVVLNKADLDPAAKERAAEVSALGFGAPVILLDSINRVGYEELGAHIKRGRTMVLVGSSGSGKSTIINNLMGANLQRTGAVRADDSKGRHTTTGRKLFVLPESGALLIDTPGMRGLELWADEQTVQGTFEDILALAAQCRFGNCSHTSEPGCAVREAIERGELDRAHYDNYLKILAEASFLKAKTDPAERIKRKERERKFGKKVKDIIKRQDKRR